VRIDRERILRHASPFARAVLLYGSRARGDDRPDSDIDVLQILRTAQPSRAVEEIMLSSYTLPQLQKMAQQGSLFIAHVVTEAIPLHDPEGLLANLRRFYRPANYSYFLDEITWAAQLLTESVELFAAREM
jgi:hypothetical protein